MDKNSNLKNNLLNEKDVNSKNQKVLLYTTVFGLLFGTYFSSVLFKKEILGYISTEEHMTAEDNELENASDVRVYEILNKHDDKSVGIDVSEYQGNIDWKNVSNIKGTFPVDFVFIRSTCGTNKVDKKFTNNWISSQKNKMVRGAYHYFRPDENSTEQAKNFIRTVSLKKGDLPPVLDIERLPKHQSMASLKLGLKRWLNMVERHYGVRPIIYTGEHYYLTYLKNDFKDYTFWIANYSNRVSEVQDEWLIWQFTDKARVSGINGNVDVNVFNGSHPKMLLHTID